MACGALARSGWLPAVLGLWLSACATASRPPIMAQVEQVRMSPASVEAQIWAPQAHAHAIALEQRAERALAQGDSTSAELLAAHTVAAHEHAWVLTRLARAERRRLDAGR